jgi:hypothetical protein
MPKATVTERTFYPALKDVIKEAGGTSVQEVSYNSVPDILFNLGNRPWILSVKIGEDIGTIKAAMIQYLRHKEESKIAFGMLLLLPDSVRKVEPTEEAVNLAVKEIRVTSIIDAGIVKEEIRDRTFPDLVSFIKKEILDRLRKKKSTYYPLNLVVKLLQQQVSEMMEEISIDERTVLKIVTDRDLLMDLGHLKPAQTEAVARFLASYILMSQILFLRLLYSAKQEIFISPITPVSHHSLRSAFSRVLDINYKPIFSVEVLDSIPDRFLTETFDLIWGLEIEGARHDLPGRIFHELMPSGIRKMLAAFYTRPLAADILAQLTIERSDCSVFDLASGSGTILVSAYKRKRQLFESENHSGNPHKRFCEEEIFGADVMPFAVHLTSANLAAMDVGTTIERTQIIQADSLRLAPGTSTTAGLKLKLFHQVPKARDTKGNSYEVPLEKVDVVLMNPPFTKVERGIRKFVDMDIYKDVCGGEVGLWGHFVCLADEFLKDGGIYGAVLPINILRGRESKNVREILFEKWKPLYILKPTKNYGFSEWSEYRDILYIGKKEKAQDKDRVKFCLVKKDLVKLKDKDVLSIVKDTRRKHMLRSNDLDIESFRLSEIKQRFPNMMWFCGVTDFAHRDILLNFFNRYSNKLLDFPEEYFLEGFRPVPKGVSKFMFLTRHSDDSRIQEAFLRFSKEDGSRITASSPLGAAYQIERSALRKSLRTLIGLSKMDIADTTDYVAYKKYDELERVARAGGVKADIYNSEDFWEYVEEDLPLRNTKLVVSHRINPFSPSTFLNAYYSNHTIYPSNQVNIVREKNESVAKSVCCLLNSILFFVQFFLLKEESTGRYINVRFYDLYEMKLYPSKEMVQPLEEVYKTFADLSFPCLRQQFDKNFDERYDEFWEKEAGGPVQSRLWSILNKPTEPSSIRLKFDKAVCKSIGLSITDEELIAIYEVIVKEMIITRRLTRD